MSTKSKSDISNSAIRMFLQSAGLFYDEQRGYPRFSRRDHRWIEVLRFFSNSCCYCGVRLTAKSATEDHLVAMNKTSLGLHAWGNVAPCCRRCNNERQSKDWRKFIKQKCGGSVLRQRTAVIVRFQKKYRYNPHINLHVIARNLYDDVGEVASTLIRLRLQQAEAVIQEMVGAAKK